MPPRKMAAVAIFGFDADKRSYIDLLKLGLTLRLESTKISAVPEGVKISGQSGSRFITEDGDILDIFEVSWKQDVDQLSDKNLKTKVLGGIKLFFYWIPYGFGMARISGIFAWQVAIFMALIVLWYYGTVVMFLTAVGNDPSLLGGQLPEGWAAVLGSVGKTLGSWRVWLYTSILLSLLPRPVDLVVDTVDFTIRYMEDETNLQLGGLRDRLRHRAISVLDDVINDGSYDQVTVLSHSLGTLIGADVLGDYRHADCRSIRYMTLGSPMKSLLSRSNWLRREIQKCLMNELVTEWLDFYSPKDYLCSAVPRLPNTDTRKLRSFRVDFHLPVWDWLLGRSHQQYFGNREVLLALLDIQKPNKQVEKL